jgi:hypothetical protein
MTAALMADSCALSSQLTDLPAKLLLALASTVILGSEFHGTHQQWLASLMT